MQTEHLRSTLLQAIQHLPLYNHRACSTCGSDRIAEERNCESTGSFSTGYGGMLFRSDDRDHFQEYRKPSSGF